MSGPHQAFSQKDYQSRLLDLKRMCVFSAAAVPSPESLFYCFFCLLEFKLRQLLLDETRQKQHVKMSCFGAGSMRWTGEIECVCVLYQALFFLHDDTQSSGFQSANSGLHWNMADSS
jgi:hypothetical protein